MYRCLRQFKCIISNPQLLLKLVQFPFRNRQAWPRPVMKYTARSGPSLAQPVPVTARLCPEQPDLAPVGPCVSSLILDPRPGPDQGHSKISAWVAFPIKSFSL